jgi:hypothetical protein
MREFFSEFSRHEQNVFGLHMRFNKCQGILPVYILLGKGHETTLIVYCYTIIRKAVRHGDQVSQADLAFGISGVRDPLPSRTGSLVQHSRIDSAFYSSEVKGCLAKNALRCWCSGVLSGENSGRSRTDTATSYRPGKGARGRSTAGLLGGVHAAYDHAP